MHLCHPFVGTNWGSCPLHAFFDLKGNNHILGINSPIVVVAVAQVGPIQLNLRDLCDQTMSCCLNVIITISLDMRDVL